MKVNLSYMEGITFIHDQTNDKRYVQIALEKLEEYQEAMEDLLDAIVIESRKSEPTMSFDELTTRLKLAGKL